MLISRFGLSTSVVDGKIYAIGGWRRPPDRVTSDVEEYDPATDTRTKKAPMPTARQNFSSASVVNGIIYVIGGGNAGTVFSTVEAYNPATDTWTEKTDMPTARGALATSAVNGKIYAIGGSLRPPWIGISTVEEYDTGFVSSKKTSSIEPKGKLVTTWAEIKSY